MIHVYNFFLKSRAFKRTVASQKESNQHASAPDPSLKEIMMIMKKMVPLLISLFLLISFSPALAETKTFIKQYTDQVSEDDNRDSSRTIALREVKRLLLEELGIYLESETEVENFQLTKDRIAALAAGIAKTEIIDEQWDGRTYWLKAKISADSGDFVKSIDALRKNRAKTKELEEVRRRSDELLKENEKLRKESAVTKDGHRQEQKTAYDKIIKELMAIEWFEKGYASAISGNHRDAMDALSKAIELNPKDAAAYHNRGTAYDQLDNYNQATRDLKMAARLGHEKAKEFLRERRIDG